MKRLRKTQISILFCLLFVLLNPYEISGHSGNTDSYGGHKKNSNGTYHCHSGQCLEDARKRAYEIAFHSGQEAGRLEKVNGYEEYKDALWERVQTGKVDPDEAEYMIPYVLMAYQEGFEDTYVPPPPTFWGKYGYYIAVAPYFLLFIYFAILILFMVVLTVIEWLRNIKGFFR